MKKKFQCVNYVRARGLNHRQFKVFLEYLDCDYPDVVYFSTVHWLSRAATSWRFNNMQQEIKLFMESKHLNMPFISDENWLFDLTFLTDIAQHLTDLNLKLQGKSHLVNKLLDHICAFDTKIELFPVQLGRPTLIYFTCLAARKIEFRDLDSTNYAASVHGLRDEFAGMFPASVHGLRDEFAGMFPDFR